MRAATTSLVFGLGLCLGGCDDAGREGGDAQADDAELLADAYCGALPGGCVGTGKFDGVDFRQIIFDLVFGDVGVCPHSDRITQSHFVDDDGLITMVTDLRVQADLDAAVGALSTPWTNWWRYGRAEGYAYSTEGTEFTFFPIGVPFVTVDVEQGTPQPNLSDPTTGQTWDMGIELTLSDDFTGPARLLVRETDDGVVIREVWHGVRPTGPLADLDLSFVEVEEVAAKLHGWTARGCLVPPGTGYPGLVDLLEAEQDDDARHGDRITSDHSIGEGSEILVTTSARLDPRVGSEEILAALFETDWMEWWKHGLVSDRQEVLGEDGEVAQVRFGLSPVSVVEEEFDWKLTPINVEVVMDAPVRTSPEGEPEAWRIDVELSGDFFGPARFEVVDTGSGFVVSSIWEEIETSRCGSASADPDAGLATRACRKAFAYMHSLAERGRMPGPLSGSGFPGLIDYLE